MRIQVVVGGQYGSEGKGAVAAHLAAKEENLVAVRVGGSQAGHTVIDSDSFAWPLRHVPVAAVVNPMARLYIGPGSEIDPVVLADEVERLDDAGFGVSPRLAISPAATLIEDRHKEIEATADLTGRLGSTAKGVGAARADRLMRRAKLWSQSRMADWFPLLNPEEVYHSSDQIQIEGVQGYALGLHAGYYPYCTSGDATAVDFIAMAGIPAPWNSYVQVYMALRPHPIRVAGNSGPMLNETTWEELGLGVERTTVTKKVRRVGGWDQQLAFSAARANGGSATAPVRVALTMIDHVYPELAGQRGPARAEDLPLLLRRFMGELSPTMRVVLLGTGPATMIEVF